MGRGQTICYDNDMIKAVIFDYSGVLFKKLQLQSELFDYARELTEQGYQTAVLSNLIRPAAWLVKWRGDLASFQTVVISSDVRLAKPNPRIYQLMLERLGVEPWESVFVDNRLRNLAPAKTLGIHVIHARYPRQIIQDIQSLLEAGSA